jgi:hypothetical protein
MAATSLGLAQAALAAALVGALGGGLAYGTFRYVAEPRASRADAPWRTPAFPLSGGGA